MKLKKLSVIMLTIGVILLLVGVIAPFVMVQIHIAQNGPITLIGVPDDPMLLMVWIRMTSGWPLCCVVFGISFVVGSVLSLVFGNMVKTHTTVKTSALSLGISASVAAVLACAAACRIIAELREFSDHPFLYSSVIAFGVLSILAAIASVVFYGKERKIQWSLKGVLIDALTAVLYFPAFLVLFSYLTQI